MKNQSPLEKSCRQDFISTVFDS